MDSSGVEPPSMFICLDPIKYITDHANSEKEDDTSDGVSAWDVATFYVDMTKVQNQKFNIRLIVFDDDKTRYMPIIIDPKVENQG